MNYKKTIDWMFSQLPMYQRTGKTAYKKDLTNIKALCKINDNVHTKFKSIHIGGTNGKGSVSNILASIYQTGNYKVGLYTSPHLKDFRERIKINGEMISKEEVTDFIKKFTADFKKIKPSFFEMTVAMAFDHFAKHNVDIAIIEVGLGGRLDSTNIITPILSVITNISFDHTQFLGNTLSSIAKEKAGIIKPEVPVIIGESNIDTDKIFITKAKKTNSKIKFADKLISITNSSPHKDLYTELTVRNKNKNYTILTDIHANYQQKNIVTALGAIDMLLTILPINRSDILTGLKNIKKHTGFSGRWQTISKRPLIIADTGHNIAGIHEINNQLRHIKYNNLHIIFAVVNDKQINDILKLMPRDALYYFTKAQIPRSLNEIELKKEAAKYGLKGNSYKYSILALEEAKKNASEEDFVMICGSTFLVAELI